MEFPHDLVECHEMIRELLAVIAQKEQLNQRLQHRLAQLLRAKYGPKSEKIAPNQLLLFAEAFLAQERVWVYAGDTDHPFVVYHYTPDRSRDGPATFLKKYKGSLQADAYAGYDHLYATGDVVEVACWAHARRKFKDATPTNPESAYLALAYSTQLYSVERLATEENLDTAGRLALRQEKSVPVLHDFERWLRAEAGRMLPKSPVGEAIHYALNNWTALCRYAENGILAIDNTKAEQALRPISVGRKNWLFFGSDNGGRTGAILFSLLRTCHALGKNPFHYLRDVLARIADHPVQDLDALLPDRWTQPTELAEPMLPVAEPSPAV